MSLLLYTFLVQICYNRKLISFAAKMNSNKHTRTIMRILICILLIALSFCSSLIWILTAKRTSKETGQCCKGLIVFTKRLTSNCLFMHAHTVGWSPSCINYRVYHAKFRSRVNPTCLRLQKEHDVWIFWAPEKMAWEIEKEWGWIEDHSQLLFPHSVAWNNTNFYAWGSARLLKKDFFLLYY